MKSEASEISIKICNADDENVVIQLFRNDTREQKQDRKKKKGQTQMMRQSAGGVHRQKHNTKNYHHSDKHQSHKNKCKCKLKLKKFRPSFPMCKQLSNNGVNQNIQKKAKHYNNLF